MTKRGIQELVQYFRSFVDLNHRGFSLACEDCRGCVFNYEKFPCSKWHKLEDVMSEGGASGMKCYEMVRDSEEFLCLTLAMLIYLHQTQRVQTVGRC